MIRAIFAFIAIAAITSLGIVADQRANRTTTPLAFGIGWVAYGAIIGLTLT